MFCFLVRYYTPQDGWVSGLYSERRFTHQSMNSFFPGWLLLGNSLLPALCELMLVVKAV